MNIIHLDDLTYDYTQITDPNTRTLAQRAADDIKPRLRRATEDILVIGQRLAVVRQYIPHGQWTSWIETEFGMADETARQFIRVATRFTDKSLIIRDLKPTALYMLAAPSTPDDAITQVEALITNGHTPTVAETKQIITTVRAGLVPAPVVPAPVVTSSRDKLMQAAQTGQQLSQVAAVIRVINDQPDAATTILDDLANGRRGWYHNLILCYTDDTDTETWRAVAGTVQRQFTQSPNHPIPQSPAPSPTDNKALSPETPRDRRIAQAQSLPATTYNVVLADPPWQYNNTGVNGAAANHYNTMSFSQLSALPDQIGLDIAPNAVLFLWATNPMLADALDLIHNWGFTYKTNMVWVKDRIGTGFYVRGMHELLLICTKGAMTPINPNSTPPITSVINAPTQEHSRKPDQVHQLIEQLYPDCNYIELFARRQRAGWDVWGNEVNQ